MKIFVNLAIILAAALLGLGVGLALKAKRIHRATEPAPTAAISSNAQSQSQTSVSAGSLELRPDDNFPLAAKLERNLAKSSGITRWLYWLDAVEKATPADFPALARLAESYPAALQFVATRWVEIAPRQMFDSLVAAAKNGSARDMRELVDVLFKEWPKRDPEAVVAALNEPGNLGPRHYWREEAATTIINHDFERGLRLFAEWRFEGYMPFYDERGPVPKWAAADPRHAAEFVLQNPAGYVSEGVVKVVGEEWAKSDPVAAVQFAQANPGQLGALLGTAALKKWADQNLNEAADWLAQADERTRNNLSPGFVQTWAKKDAAGALAWCEENLSGSGLAGAVPAIIEGAGIKEIASTAALVATMDPSPARAAAAVAVAQQWFPSLGGRAGPGGNETVKPETIAWLSGLDTISIKRVLDAETWSWATSDPRTMADFLLTVSSEAIPNWTDANLARQMVTRNPADALEWASRLPQNRALNAGAEAYAEWRSTQPEAAIQWLSDLPADDARRQPFLEASFRQMAYDPRAAQQFAGISPEERSIARQVVEGMTSLTEDRRARLLAVLKP